MKVDYIEISDSHFKKIVDYPISELEFALGLICVIEDGKIIGSTILYKNPYFKAPNNNALLFGYFNAKNLAVATLIFSKIEVIAKNNELSKLIGPINGSTWYNYRLMNAHNNRPFIGEEVTPLAYNAYLIDNNFKVLKNYQSNLANSKDFSEQLIQQKEAELNQKNWKTRPLNNEDLKNDLDLIADFSNKAFASNFLYSPIKKTHFIEKYTPLMQQLPTNYIWLVENTEGELKAVMLAYENLLNGNKELIIKTTARDPICEIKGIGMYLCNKVTKQAHEIGIKQIIHAYIANENNSSVSISQEKLKASMYREYSLYYKNIKLQ